jgi:hypothetical protein
MMNLNGTSFIRKLGWNIPWLVRYPGSRAAAFLEQTAFEKKHIIFTVADHFEPGWSEGGILGHREQMRRLRAYYKLARATGNAVRDSDGTKFRHTNFYPAEQYHPDILGIMSEMQAEGLGEVEVHLHHGVERPDTAANLRSVLTDFRDTLADEHKCLSRIDGTGKPMYAFVHGNLALGNSAGGRFCGVDSEMQVLRETGCYADMTLPSAPDRSQVAIINRIYECGGPLDQAMPHRTGVRVAVNGRQPSLPLIFTGPLVFNWTRRVRGIPVPRIDDGALTANQPADIARLKRWLSANVTVAGRSDWIFVKLYCHGFFDRDMQASIGEGAKRFFEEIAECGAGRGNFDIYFASAREAFNMTAAAIDGRPGRPGEYRDYRLRAIMNRA